MSYARMGNDSDIYVILSGYGYICYNCKLQREFKNVPGIHRDFVTEDVEKMTLHVVGHKAKGHMVPDYCINRLLSEIEWLEYELKYEENGYEDN